MISPVLNSIETNPWSFTNSNALAFVLMESIFTIIFPPFFLVLAYRFSNLTPNTPCPTFVILIIYSLSNSLILLILLKLFYLCFFSYLPIYHKFGLSAVKDSRFDQKTLNVNELKILSMHRSLN